MTEKKLSGSAYAQLSLPWNVSLMEEEHLLMERVQQGDVAAFRKLYDRYKSRVMSYLNMMVRNRAVAEELAQEAFLRVYRARASYGREAKFSTWMWTIARNLAIDHLRKKTETLLDPHQQEGSHRIEEIESPLSNAEVMLIRNSRQEQVEKCLSKLTHAQREVLTLRTLSELNYDEIAATMKTTLASVKSLIFRAKEALIHCLKKSES